LAEPIDRIVSCAGVGTTNLAFGGPERKTLFITESRTGTLLQASLETSGMTMFSHAA
jgi:gluconolactonase